MPDPLDSAQIEQETFLDVKRACHFWLMQNSMEYRSEQKHSPDRVKFSDLDRDVNIADKSDLRSRKKKTTPPTTTWTQKTTKQSTLTTGTKSHASEAIHTLTSNWWKPWVRNIAQMAHRCCAVQSSSVSPLLRLSSQSFISFAHYEGQHTRSIFRGNEKQEA